MSSSRSLESSSKTSSYILNPLESPRVPVGCWISDCTPASFVKECWEKTQAGDGGQDDEPSLKKKNWTECALNELILWRVASISCRNVPYQFQQCHAYCGYSFKKSGFAVDIFFCERLAKRHHSVRKVTHIIVRKCAFHKSCHAEVAIVHMFKFARHWYKFTLPSTLAKPHTTVECANAVNISCL
jgi:hypothetical protein